MTGIRIELKAGGTHRLFKPKDHDGIYAALMRLTKNDHEESAGAASWAELAGVGETYELNNGGELEVIDLEGACREDW